MPRQLQREAWRKASDDNKGRSPAVIRSENSRITLGVLENSRDPEGKASLASAGAAAPAGGQRAPGSGLMARSRVCQEN